jgi:hypothetical protein
MMHAPAIRALRQECAQQDLPIFLVAALVSYLARSEHHSTRGHLHKVRMLDEARTQDTTSWSTFTTAGSASRRSDVHSTAVHFAISP